MENRAASQRRYANSAKGKATRLRHRNTPLRKETKRRYFRSRKFMWMRARSRARKCGFPFTCRIEDIPDMPLFCPVLGMPLAYGNGKQENFSPSLDRIRPELGYVAGNIRIISHRANMLKNDATWQELLAVGEDLKRIIQQSENKEDYGTAKQTGH
jgi:hypothetical protein